jgi:RNA polymerase sigma factor (sigma-70 family)
MTPTTPDEATELCRRWQQDGDLAARNELVERNMPLVLHIVKGFKGIDWADLVQVGSIGLMRAANDYTPSKGASFATYAWRWVFVEMQRLADQTRLISIPYHLRYTTKSTAQRMKSDPRFAARREIMLRQSEAVKNRPDTLHSGGNEELTASSTIIPDPCRQVADKEEHDVRLAKVMAAMETIDPTDVDIILSKHFAETPESPTAIGRRIGKSHEWVRQREQAAIRRIRIMLGVTA